MSFELSNDDKKSLAITTVVYALLILLLFLLRFWPPADMKIMGGGGGGGIEMNFGDSDYGMGDNYKSEVLNVKDQAKVAPTTTSPEDNIISDENDDDDTNVAIPKKDIKKTPTPVVPKKDIKPAPEKPKVSKNANDALSSILGNKGGDGNDTKGGNKGSANGNLNSSGYYGNGSGTGSGGGNGSGTGTGTGSGTGSGNGSGNGGGNGSGSGYSLGNRKALSKPQPDYTCQEQGRVAVQVTVDRNGNTVSVTAGVQGTTNTAKCLLDQAKIAAMQTRWQADANAPEKQVGKIIYTFSLN
ncbi:energy transducer TonB [Flavobacterium sp. IMCC34852]|uniref:Energy transducer TonB n=1 Tax=Flavobacterium rivulicola TaxID=2732161 RepID=A0A7Y3VZ61_9FLAO|nr:energy transducer TonB [Flavobacterium sp. IMCC34852]NNT72409.1 energy transducer TonB [Flavobacterium sp. IMCC34852]